MTHNDYVNWFNAVEKNISETINRYVNNNRKFKDGQKVIIYNNGDSISFIKSVFHYNSQALYLASEIRKSGIHYTIVQNGYEFVVPEKHIKPLVNEITIDE